MRVMPPLQKDGKNEVIVVIGMCPKFLDDLESGRDSAVAVQTGLAACGLSFGESTVSFNWRDFCWRKNKEGAENGCCGFSAAAQKVARLLTFIALHMRACAG